jgi:hypothetical protein
MVSRAFRLGIGNEAPMTTSMPSLTVTERGDHVRLQLGGLACGEGTSLQDAADDLIRRLLGLALAVRSTGFRASLEVQPNFEAMDFLYELGEIAAAGGDIREHVLG